MLKGSWQKHTKKPLQNEEIVTVNTYLPTKKDLGHQCSSSSISSILPRPLAPKSGHLLIDLCAHLRFWNVRADQAGDTHVMIRAGVILKKTSKYPTVEIKPQLAIPKVHPVYTVWIPPPTFPILSPHMLNAGGLWPCFGLGGNVRFQLLVLLPRKTTIRSISKWPKWKRLWQVKRSQYMVCMVWSIWHSIPSMYEYFHLTPIPIYGTYLKTIKNNQKTSA